MKEFKDRKVILDTETTGLNFRLHDRIIEIAALEIFEDKCFGNELRLLINPSVSISSDASKVHGIKDEDLKDAPSFSEVVEQILEFIKDDQIIAHNAEFDRGFLNKELDLCGKSQLERARFIDTLTLAKKRFPNKKNSLDDLCKRFYIDKSSRAQYHGALIDVKLLGKIYINLLYKDLLEKIELNHTRGVSDSVIKIKNDILLNRKFALSAIEIKNHQEFVKKINNPIWVKKDYI